MTTRHPHRRRDLIPTSSVRENTNKVLEMIGNGLLDPNQVVLMCLKWMSEDEVTQMCKANEIDLEDHNDDDYTFMSESEDI